jgi:hypothetical protein
MVDVTDGADVHVRLLALELLLRHGRLQEGTDPGLAGPCGRYSFWVRLLRAFPLVEASQGGIRGFGRFPAERPSLTNRGNRATLRW